MKESSRETRNLKKVFGILLAIFILPAAFFAQNSSIRKNSSGMEFVTVPAGSFKMGLNDTDLAKNTLYDLKNHPDSAKLDWYADEIPQRLVRVSSFLVGTHEVTQAQWRAVMDFNPSAFKNCDKCPVDSVSWNQVKEFIALLNAKNDGFSYRLPTEAEWEYAARAGTTTHFASGDTLASTQANFDGDYPYGGAPKGIFLEMTAPVGSYKPNAWGLYDMHGNVYEWVEDVHSINYLGLPSDGSANTTIGETQFRVLRGGSWKDLAWYCRPFIRWNNLPDFKNSEIGFRLVAVPAK